MTVVYAREALPTSVVKSIFLAGPTPRDKSVPSWRPDALKALSDLGFNGHVFVPEPREGVFTEDYVEQVEWESDALNMADVVVFWVPREMKTMPALTTNVEFGVWADSGKAILGYPEGAESVRYLQHMADKLKIPSVKTLPDTMTRALEILGEGAPRVDGEAKVPLLIWNHPTFQRWYAAQRKVGNRLDSAKLLWTFRVGPNRDKVFCWVLHVNVWIRSEGRVKSNEFVFGRTDISSIALFYRPEEKVGTSDYLFDTEVLLVREFRSPARTPSGDIMELPGGSSKTDTGETLRVAVEELKEETSFGIDPARMTELGTLQIAGTLSAHTSTLFASRLTKEERDQIWKIASSGKTFGVEEDTEKTYVEIRTLRQIMEHNMVDWSTLGMILTSILTDGTHT